MFKTALIYQMGKVGSATVQRSLSRAGLYWVRPGSETPHNRDAVIPTHVHEEARSILERSAGREVIILSQVRELLGRTISAFFTNLAHEGHRWWYIGPRERVLSMPISALIGAFRERHSEHLKHFVEPWFDNFGAVTGSNVFATPVAVHDDPLIALPGSKYRAAVVRLEDLNRSEARLRAFFDAPRFQLITSNEMDASDRWQADLYRRFLKEFRATDQELSDYYDTRTMRHFYSSDEIAAFAARWQGHGLR